MQQDRRKFLRGLAAACATGIGHGLTRSTTLVAAGAATGAAAAQATAAVAASTVVPTYIYGAGVRGQVFEVVVRQALAGAPWKEICHGPMHVNNITPEEIEKEVERRKAIVHDTDFPTACQCVSCVKARTNFYKAKSDQKQASLAAIPHSTHSPCACNECFDEIARLRNV